MKAVGLYQYLPIEKPDSLVELDLPKPEPIGRDLLVRVEAVSVNPVDTKVRAPGNRLGRRRSCSDGMPLGWSIRSGRRLSASYRVIRLLCRRYHQAGKQPRIPARG